LKLHSLVPEVWTVLNKRRDSEDVWTLTLTCKGGECDYLPGQFNMLGTFGGSEVPISVSGDTGKKGEIVHTIRDVGAATHALVQLKKGDPVALRGPYGHGWPVAKAVGKDVLFVAGGLGLAPLRPAILEVLKNRNCYAQVFLLYGARQPDQILFHRDLKKWAGQKNIHVEITVDQGHRGWKGHLGAVTQLLEPLPLHGGRTKAFICGPEIMMRFVSLELEACGLEKDQIWLSMERNMKCAMGWCGHCQYGSSFICKDGPVYSLNQLEPWLARKGV